MSLPREKAVTVDGLTVGYGILRRQPVLRELTLEIEAATVTGLIGVNGAGKTTLLRSLLGFLPPWKGRVSVFGEEAGRHRRRHGTGYLPESPKLPSGLTVFSLLEVGSRLSGLGGAEARADVRSVLETTRLAELAGATASTLSKGQAKRAALAYALTGSPRLLLLDEPESGLDLRARVILREVIGELGARGSTVLIASHDLGELQKSAQRIVALEDGRVSADVPTDLLDGDGLEALLLRARGGS